MSTNINTLQAVLGYRFSNTALLRNALTHSSYVNECRLKGCCSNERLEFLGDSVLGVVVAEYLYQKFPQLPEGELSRLRASVVCEESLAEVALQMGLGGFLLLGRGEDKSGGRDRASILSDAVEALIAAVYLDGGFEMARSFVLRWLEPHLQISVRYGGLETDYKTRLQECVQGKNCNAVYCI